MVLLSFGSKRANAIQPWSRSSNCSLNCDWRFCVATAQHYEATTLAAAKCVRCLRSGFGGTVPDCAVGYPHADPPNSFVDMLRRRGTMTHAYMDFIERWFHVSPDGGNGMTELTILTAFAVLVAVIYCRRQVAELTRCGVALNKKKLRP